MYYFGSVNETGLIEGGLYKFKNDPAIRQRISGKWFRVLPNRRIVVFNDDGSIILNGNGEPYFTYSNQTILKHVECPSIEPFRNIPKFSFCVEE